VSLDTWSGDSSALEAVTAGETIIVKLAGTDFTASLTATVMSYPAGAVVMQTTRSSGTETLSAPQTTSGGQYKVDWWDGTTSTINSNTNATKAIAAPYNTSAPKTIVVYPASSVDTMKKINPCSNCTYYDSRLAALTTLTVNNVGSMATFKLGNQAATITSLTWTNGGSGITGTLDLTGYTLLTNVSLTGGSFIPAFTGLNLTGCSGLTDLTVAGLTSLASLTLASNAALVNFSVTGCTSLVTTSIDLTGAAVDQFTIDGATVTSFDAGSFAAGYTGGYPFTVTGCSNLATLRAVGIGAAFAVQSGIAAQSGNLNAAAINQLFTDLANITGQAGDGSTVDVTDNPGAATCTQSIATAKGWNVYA
jgi:hypothetical protein